MTLLHTCDSPARNCSPAQQNDSMTITHACCSSLSNTPHDAHPAPAVPPTHQQPYNIPLPPTWTCSIYPPKPTNSHTIYPCPPPAPAVYIPTPPQAHQQPYNIPLPPTWTCCVHPPSLPPKPNSHTIYPCPPPGPPVYIPTPHSHQTNHNIPLSPTPCRYTHIGTPSLPHSTVDDRELKTIFTSTHPYPQTKAHFHLCPIHKHSLRHTALPSTPNP